MSETIALPTVEELLELDIKNQASFAEAYPDGIEVKVRHGLLSYYQIEEGLTRDGTWGNLLTEQFGMHQQKVKITFYADYVKAVQTDAIYGHTFPDPADEVTADDETEEVELFDLEDDELVDWIMSTGRFDGEKKPNAKEVIAAAEGDSDNAERLLTAEKTATGDQPRGEVVTGLSKLIDG